MNHIFIIYFFSFEEANILANIITEKREERDKIIYYLDTCVTSILTIFSILSVQISQKNTNTRDLKMFVNNYTKLVTSVR